MSRLRLGSLTGAIVAVALAATRTPIHTTVEARGRQDVSVPALLSAAGAYLDRLARRIDGVVVLEEYFQEGRATIPLAQRSKSDLILMRDDDAGWIEFRDTYEVNGKAVVDRSELVIELLTSPGVSARERGRRLIEEGARFNLAPTGLPISRTINLPMVALMFLRSTQQDRSRFVRDRWENVGGERTAVLRFTEEARPRLILTPDDAAASGFFWVVPATGEVRRTELRIETARDQTRLQTTIRVDYRPVLGPAVWLPQRMTENYTVSVGAAVTSAGHINGTAQYRDHRTFQVTSEERRAEP